MGILRVLTWNMGYWQYRKRHEKAWEYLREEVKPDIALLQECRPVEMSDNEQLLFKEIYQGWGTAIYLRNASVKTVEFEQYPGRVVGAVAEFPGLPALHLASIHAPIINQRVFPHLDKIFTEIEKKFNYKISIIGGDLNSARLAEKVWPRHGHGPFFDRIDESWFVDCRKRFYDSEIQTIFRPRQKHPFQDDHIFISQNLLEHVTKYHVLNNEVTRKLSDHIPVLIELHF